MEDRVKLEKYIKPSPKQYVFGIILMIAGAAALAVEIVMFDQLMLGIVWLGFGVILGSIFIAVGAIKGSLFKKRMDELDKKGDLPDVLYDFQTGKPMFNGSLILEKYFLISKKSGDVVEYCDIEKLYQLVKGNGSNAKRIIQIRTVDKKKINLCKIPVSGSKVGEELGKVLGLITAKNRNIQL